MNGDDDIGDIRAGLSGDDQVVESFEKMVAVVVREQFARVQPGLAGAVNRFPGANGSGGVTGSVDAVGAE